MGLDTRRRAWLDPPDADAATLKTLTLTNLNDKRPTWLCQRARGVGPASYGWPEDPAATEEETILGRLLALNLERVGSEHVD